MSNEKSYESDEIHTKFNEIDANFQKYKQITDDTINNLKDQIEYQNTVSISKDLFLQLIKTKRKKMSLKFFQERLTYHNLWKISQQTINNLEVEINQYLKQSNNSDSLLNVRFTFTVFVNSVFTTTTKIHTVFFLLLPVKKANSSFRTKNRRIEE